MLLRHMPQPQGCSTPNSSFKQVRKAPRGAAMRAVLCESPSTKEIWDEMGRGGGHFSKQAFMSHVVLLYVVTPFFGRSASLPFHRQSNAIAHQFH